MIDRVSAGLGVPHYRKAVNTRFFDTWSPPMAYVLGYFAADGSMYVNSHGATYVSFTSTDRILLEHVRELLHAEHRITRRRRREPHWKAVYRLQIGGSELFDSLTSVGFTPNKDERLRLPAIPTEHIGAFTRGVFDGDGCISYGWYSQRDRQCRSLYVQACFASGTLSFLRDLDRAICERTGMAPGYLRQRDIGAYLYYQRRSDLRTLYDFMYPETMTDKEHLPRKRLRFREALQLLVKS